MPKAAARCPILQNSNFLMFSAAMPRHGNQTLINIMQMKREPIAFDSPRFTLKLIEDQGCKYYDKKFGLLSKN